MASGMPCNKRVHAFTIGLDRKFFISICTVLALRSQMAVEYNIVDINRRIL